MVSFRNAGLGPAVALASGAVEADEGPPPALTAAHKN